MSTFGWRHNAWLAMLVRIKNAIIYYLYEKSKRYRIKMFCSINIHSWTRSHNLFPMKDPYKALGVSRNQGSAEIKKAYRSLAIKYHPDNTGGDRVKEIRFTEISSAYETLKDNKKKDKFDRFGDIIGRKCKLCSTTQAHLDGRFYTLGGSKQ